MVRSESRKELYGVDEEKVEEIKENYVSNKSFFSNLARYIIRCLKARVGWRVGRRREFRGKRKKYYRRIR